PPAGIPDQQFQRFPHRDVVVDDEDNWRGIWHVQYLGRVPVIGGPCSIGGRCCGRAAWCCHHRYLIRSADWSAVRRAASVKGLKRHSTAPSDSKRARIVLSALAVMNTIGICCPSVVSSRCKSGPDIPGIFTSRIRQCVRLIASEARNSWADEKAAAVNPNW